jgi:hypothetical protein
MISISEGKLFRKALATLLYTFLSNELGRFSQYNTAPPEQFFYLQDITSFVIRMVISKTVQDDMDLAFSKLTNCNFMMKHIHITQTLLFLIVKYTTVNGVLFLVILGCFHTCTYIRVYQKMNSISVHFSVACGDVSASLPPS